MEKIRIGNREIGTGCDPLVIAEIGINHNGSLKVAKEMVDAVLERTADMVIGDRLSSTYFQENKRPFHNFGNSLVRAGINRLFGCKIKDIMTGYRAFGYGFVKTFPVL